MIDRESIRRRYEVVQTQIAAAAQRAGRSAEAVTLVAVTKTWPAELVVAAYEVGLRHFGENRAEELAEKRPQVEAAIGPDSSITWHFIGTLQSRKTHFVSEYADVFHALDRQKIARRLSAELSVNGRTLPSFWEVNISGEASKAGLDCINWEEDATQREALRTLFTETVDMPGLAMLGLMTMAPWDVPPDEIRQVFRRTRQLAEWLRDELPDRRPPALSMGMTDDFEIAIEEGATHVRVGRALFGERHTG